MCPSPNLSQRERDFAHLAFGSAMNIFLFFAKQKEVPLSLGEVR